MINIYFPYFLSKQCSHLMCMFVSVLVVICEPTEIL